MCVIDREQALAYLGDRSKEIPCVGEEVVVYNVPNIGQGGQAVNVTDQIGEVASALAVKAAAMVGLRCSGVDLLCHDLGSDNPDDFAVIEINTMPSFVVHEYPHVGEPINVAEMFLREITKHPRLLFFVFLSFFLGSWCFALLALLFVGHSHPFFC